MNVDSFLTLYEAGRVKRYHTVDVPAQDLAQHSWGVAMVVIAIYPKGENYAEIQSKLVRAALYHDLHECATGDVPATAKWYNKRIEAAHETAESNFNEKYDLKEELTQPEKRILKWADTFELCLYCRHQARLGNEYAWRILINGLNHINNELGFPTSESHSLYETIFGAEREL